MKIIEANSKGRATVSISKTDWMRMGQAGGWQIPGDATQTETNPNETTDSGISKFFSPNVEVTKYSRRTWAVYIDGELLCVTVYKKGAEAVKMKLEELYGMLEEAYETR